MELQEQFEVIINKAVDERVSQIEAKLVKPFILTSDISRETQKESRWIRDNWCTPRFEKLGLVKKIGGSWHFKHPEFLTYIHDVWWTEQK